MKMPKEEEIDVLEILDDMAKSRGFRGNERFSGEDLLIAKYIIWRLDGNPDPLKDDDSLQRWVKHEEELVLFERALLSFNKKKTNWRYPEIPAICQWT